MEDPIILFEDNHIMVVLKPQNVPSCEDESKDPDMLTILKNYIKKRDKKPGNVFMGLVHRLDRPTGGVMVYAKTSKAASRLGEQMQEGDFSKRYAAVVCGILPEKEKRLTDYLKKNPVNNMVYVCNQAVDGAKLAMLDYEVLEEKGGLSLVEITLHTGRTHQIRVQMSNLGFPVYGDMRYGGENAVKGNLALFATSLSFTHPVTKKRMTFKIEPPEDLNPWNKFDVSVTVKPRI